VEHRIRQVTVLPKPQVSSETHVGGWRGADEHASGAEFEPRWVVETLEASQKEVLRDRAGDDARGSSVEKEVRHGSAMVLDAAAVA
jgi:hypothetical protein